MNALGDLLATGVFFGLAFAMGFRLWRSFERANGVWAPKERSPEPERGIDDMRPGDPRLN